MFYESSYSCHDVQVWVSLQIRDVGGVARLALLLYSVHQPGGHGVHAQTLYLHKEVPFYLNQKRIGTPAEFTQEPTLHTQLAHIDWKLHSSTIVVGIVGTEDLRRDGAPGGVMEQHVCCHK